MQTFIIKLVYAVTAMGYPLIAQELNTDIIIGYYRGMAVELIHDSTVLSLNQARNFNNNDPLLEKAYSGLPQNFVSVFVRTVDGQSYKATTKGIRMWDYSTYITISTENSHLPENNVTALALDLEENLWIGTYSSGVVKGIGDPIKPYRVRPIKTRDQNILSIYADEYGFIWIFFQNGGIECFRKDISYAYFPPRPN